MLVCPACFSHLHFIISQSLFATTKETCNDMHMFLRGGGGGLKNRGPYQTTDLTFYHNRKHLKGQANCNWLRRLLLEQLQKLWGLLCVWFLGWCCWASWIVKLSVSILGIWICSFVDTSEPKILILIKQFNWMQYQKCN